MRRAIMRAWCVTCALTLYAASLAGAATFSVAGSEDPTKYVGFFITQSQPYPQADPWPIIASTPAGPWSQAGQWMTFNNPDQSWPMSENSGNLPGTYTYLTFFDLTGFLPETAVLEVSWASDNGSDLYLNGLGSENYVGSTPSGDYSFQNLVHRVITSGFVEGINVLQFNVHNDPYGPEPSINPTGLLVTIGTATADLAPEPVPEPSTMLLLTGGLTLLALARRRARR